MKQNLYKNYTTTSVLSDVNVEKFTLWSQKYFKAFILPHIPKDKNCKILEIGCGYGRYTSLISHTLGYTNTIGIDISEEQIEYARQNYKLDNVFQTDALVFLESRSDKYDIVILMDVLEHLELDYAVCLLQKINDSLNPGGKLIIQVPNGLSPLKPIFYGDVTHTRPFSVQSMSQILRMSNFSKFRNLPLKPFIHNAPSFVRWLAYTFFIHPAIYIFISLSHGSPAGGIYTSNLLTIAYK